MEVINALFKDLGIVICIAALAFYNVVYGLVKRETWFFVHGRVRYAEKPELYVAAMIIYALILACFAWLIVNSLFAAPSGPLGPQV